MATVTALSVRCAARFHDTANSIVSQAEWVNLLNDAYSWVHNQMGSSEWAHKQATATLSIGAAATSVALPVDAQRVLVVWNDTDKVLMGPLKGNNVPRARFGDFVTTVGQPGFYRIYANTLQVYPTPTATTSIIIDYLATPSTLSLAGGGGTVTTPAFPAEYHQILVEYALFLAYVDDDNADVAGGHLQVAQGLLTQMQAALMVGQEDTYPQIVDQWYSV